MARDILNEFETIHDEAAAVDVAHKVKIGIIGCGWIAGAHIIEYLKMADVEGIDLSGDAAAWIADDAVRSAAGTVVSQTVGGVSLGGREWRSRCGLRSSCFTVTYADGEFRFAVKGYGHGVGMSQYGAQFLAQSGYTWEEILHHYYTGVEIR